ncbi:MAG: ABC transporter permease [Marinibacterium sp.]|nr:ABC transporter permease [Marinibacterium sp.]
MRVSGPLRTEALGAVEGAFRKVPHGPLVVDLGGLTALDTGGAWLIADLMARFERDGLTVELARADAVQAALIDTVRAVVDTPEMAEDERETGLRALTERVGRSVVGTWQAAGLILGFFGLTLTRLVAALARPWRLRRAALFSQMEEAGLNAIPIVALMGFLIGIVLAFQGAAQLQQFGAEVFVVDLIAISILRELGILLTAIIVAGRSGSAFTASIGSMKVQEEIDAMRVLGLDPVDVLVVPRVLALVVMLPILGFVANMAGLFGGALMSWVDLGVSPGMFITRLHETAVSHLVVGMVKAPFFAVIIGVVACYQAMQVRGSATSVGQRTTASVVQAIFMVIVADALFSIFFAELGY